MWERATGKPVYNAIVWQDTRTDTICNELAKDGGQDRFRPKVGLPLATYFSGPKIKWILDNVPGVREKAENGEVLFGNIDTWLIWNLTGGPNGGVHVTDVSNASRTMLMNLETLEWDDEILGIMGIPKAMLPRIRPSAEVYGKAIGALNGVPVAGDLGDQQAALFGQTCFSPGEAKNTYGTGCFMLMNTGLPRPVPSKNGLLTTLGYKIGNETGSLLPGRFDCHHRHALVQWLRDNLEFFDVLQAHRRLRPRRPRRRRHLLRAGLLRAVRSLLAQRRARRDCWSHPLHLPESHRPRAALGATAYQTREVLDAMNARLRRAAHRPQGRRRHGLQRPAIHAIPGGYPRRTGHPSYRCRNDRAARRGLRCPGLAVGFWSKVEDLRANWGKDHEWTPKMSAEEREKLYKGWKKAVTRTFDWVE